MRKDQAAESADARPGVGADATFKALARRRSLGARQLPMLLAKRCRECQWNCDPSSGTPLVQPGAAAAPRKVTRRGNSHTRGVAR